MSRAFLIALLLLLATPARALVMLDEGRLLINGVQLLRDAADEKKYYYLPTFPRLARSKNGDFQLLCLKYVDEKEGASGGIFHALFELSMPPSILEELQKELQREVPGARIAGPVQLMETGSEGDAAIGSFQVISSVLGNSGEDGMTSSVVTSGRAPVSPGSRAAVSALLKQRGATLLWNSFTGPTSDVSIAIRAYFEAKVSAYNAVVEAEVDNLYHHFSEVQNVQGGFQREQVQDIVDELRKNNVIKIDVFDRSESLGVSGEKLESMLAVITDRITQLMFDTETGLAREPKRIRPGAKIPGKIEEGWIPFFSGGDKPYHTDQQYILKKRDDIRAARFYVNLSKSTTRRVVLDTAGNLGALFSSLGNDERYFRIVHMADPSFEFRQVHFQLDGRYLDAFNDLVNFVAVDLRKTYPDGDDFTRSLVFDPQSISSGETVKEIRFPRLGLKRADWGDYQYRVRWAIQNRPTITEPAAADEWLTASEGAVALVPPFDKRSIVFDVDRALLKERGYSRVIVEVARDLAGETKREVIAVLRPQDAESEVTAAVFYDRMKPIAYRAVWYGREGKFDDPVQLIDLDYIVLNPPQGHSAKENEL